MAKKTPKQKATTDAARAKGSARKAAPKPAARATAKKKPTATKPQGTPAKAAPRGAHKPKPDTKAGQKSEPKPTGTDGKRPSSRQPVGKPASTAKPAESPASKPGRKGITIVTPKPAKKPRPKPSTGSVPALSGSILGMGLGTGRPLIPSGPSSAPPSNDSHETGSSRKPKSPYTKRQLEKFREVLLAKRRDLLGDIDSMESEALKSQSGSLSHLPQHMAEQGSETYEQSLSLDLAAADRVLLREIEAALQRIEDRSYGLCERTGKPISKERLAELPWARYSIEAAREMERRTT